MPAAWTAGRDKPVPYDSLSPARPRPVPGRGAWNKSSTVEFTDQVVGATLVVARVGLPSASVDARSGGALVSDHSGVRTSGVSGSAVACSGSVSDSAGSATASGVASGSSARASPAASLQDQPKPLSLVHELAESRFAITCFALGPPEHLFGNALGWVWRSALRKAPHRPGCHNAVQRFARAMPWCR